MPDIMNLKAISMLLDVSIDYLLDDGDGREATVLKETIDRSRYTHVKWYQVMEDFVVLDKYPSAVSIVQLSRTRILTKSEKIADAALVLFTDMPPAADVYDSLRDGAFYYLAETEQTQFLVSVTKDTVISRTLPSPVNAKKFTYGDNIFKKTLRKIK